MNLGAIVKDMIRRGPVDPSDPDGGPLIQSCHTPSGEMRPEISWRGGLIHYRIETARPFPQRLRRAVQQVLAAAAGNVGADLAVGPGNRFLRYERTYAPEALAAMTNFEITDALRVQLPNEFARVLAFVDDLMQGQDSRDVLKKVAWGWHDDLAPMLRKFRPFGPIDVELSTSSFTWLGDGPEARSRTRQRMNAMEEVLSQLARIEAGRSKKPALMSFELTRDQGAMHVKFRTMEDGETVAYMATATHPFPQKRLNDVIEVVNALNAQADVRVSVDPERRLLSVRVQDSIGGVLAEPDIDELEHYYFQEFPQALLGAFAAVDLLMQGHAPRDVIRRIERRRSAHPWKEPRLKEYRPYGSVDWPNDSKV